MSWSRSTSGRCHRFPSHRSKHSLHFATHAVCHHLRPYAFLLLPHCRCFFAMDLTLPRRISKSEARSLDHDSHSPRSTPSRRPSKKSTIISANPYSLNVLNAILGDRIITPYYPSLYREEFIGTETLERLWVCEKCFKYGVDGGKVWAHRVGS